MAIRITPADRALFAFLARYSMITSDALRHLDQHTESAWPKRILKLVEEGYLQKDDLFTTGERDAYWALTKKPGIENLLPKGTKPQIPTVKEGKIKFNKPLNYAKLQFCCGKDHPNKTLLTADEIRSFLGIERNIPFLNASNFYFNDDLVFSTKLRLLGFIAISQGGRDARKTRDRIEKTIHNALLTHDVLGEYIAKGLFVFTFICESEAKRDDIIKALRSRPLTEPRPWLNIVNVKKLADTRMSGGG